jgi:hypothetical protein
VNGAQRVPTSLRSSAGAAGAVAGERFSHVESSRLERPQPALDRRCANAKLTRDTLRRASRFIARHAQCAQQQRDDSFRIDVEQVS